MYKKFVGLTEQANFVVQFQRMQSKVVHVLVYLYELLYGRKPLLLALRNTILRKLRLGFQEGMGYGKAEFTEPHRIVPDAYYCDPKKTLRLSGIASQNIYIFIYHKAVDAKAFLDWLIQEGSIHFIKKLDLEKYLMCFQKAEHMAISLLTGLAQKISLQVRRGTNGKNFKSKIKYSVHA